MNPESLNNIFQSFNNKNIIIIGDIMLDSYLWGDVKRISPEAPVPIVSVTKKESRVGGAANVAVNIKHLGANPIICSALGNDENGKEFIRLLNKENITTKNIIIKNELTTTTKTRIISSNQQIIRVDEELIQDISKEIENDIINNVNSQILNNNISAIIFEDYDKGIITKSLINKIVNIANKNNIITSVDPKKKNFLSYKNVSLFKPNFKEFIEGIKLDISINDVEKIPEMLKSFEQENNINSILITLSEKGLIYHTKDKFIHVPAMQRDITDVSGAGDTVISVATLCLCSNVDLESIAKISNVAGGLVCEKVGVVPINKNQLLDECLDALI